MYSRVPICVLLSLLVLTFQSAHGLRHSPKTNHIAVLAFQASPILDKLTARSVVPQYELVILPVCGRSLEMGQRITVAGRIWQGDPFVHNPEYLQLLQQPTLLNRVQTMSYLYKEDATNINVIHRHQDHPLFRSETISLRTLDTVYVRYSVCGECRPRMCTLQATDVEWMQRYRDLTNS